jgi:hypothetical protein
MESWMLGQLAAAAWQTGVGWDEAAAMSLEGVAASQDLLNRANLLSAVALIQTARGESTDEALAALEEAAGRSSDQMFPTGLHSLQADRAMMRGDQATAYEEYLLAAEFQSLAPILLAAAVRPAAWMRDAAKVRHLVERMDVHPDAGSALPAADRVVARAVIAVLEGGVEEGIAGFRDAVRRYREIGADMLAALAILDLVTISTVVTPEIAALADEARAVMQRVRARAYLDQLDAALARDAAASPGSAGAPVDPGAAPASSVRR